MISFHRRRERPPFLDARPRESPPVRQASTPWRDWDDLLFFHASLRQGVYRYFSGSGRRRVLLPDYLPEGLFAAFRDAGLEVGFYATRLDLALDVPALEQVIKSWRPDVFLYIHHFGLYLEENVRAIRASLDPSVLFVEDFAHTLPCAGQPLSGHINLFAFAKQLGVADGGLLWCNDPGLLKPCAYGPEDGPSRTLLSRMSANLGLEDWISRWRPPPAAQSLARKVLGKRIGYYGHLAGHYRDITAGVSQAALRVLRAVDLEAVARRRRELADLYLRELRPGFRLGPPPEAFIRQPLTGFPIRVDDQDAFHSFLARRGILGFRLTDGWWFRPGAEPNELHRRHYLLPLSHYLEDREIRAVAACANAYPGSARAR